jgi:tetratricopeptide (TPR) repeat protein
VAIYTDEDRAGMVRHLERAVAEDPAFAWGLWSLYVYYLFGGEVSRERMAEVIDSLMNHLYRLPERWQFAVKSNYFEFTGEPEKQLAVLKMWAELYPDDNLALETLVQIYRVQGKHDEMFAAQERLLELEPGNPDYLTSAAQLYRDRGDLEKARGYLESLIEVSPDDPQPLLELGGLLQVMGRHQEAKARFEKALLLDPKNLELRIALSGAEFQLGNITTAEEVLQAAMADPLSPADRLEVNQALSDHFVSTGRLDLAIENITGTLNENTAPSLPLKVMNTRAWLARLLARRGDRDEALAIIADLRTRLAGPLSVLGSIYSVRVRLWLEDWEAARLDAAEIKTAIDEMQWEHMRPTWLRAMGMIYAGGGSPAEALEFFRRWNELQPTEVEPLLRMATCLRELGRHDEAADTIARVLKQVPGKAEALYETALIEHERGDDDAGLAHLRRALEVWKDADPDFDLAVEAREKLALWTQGS